MNFEKYIVNRVDPKQNLEGLLRFPKYVEIETVNACNARCPMCTINDWERNYPIMKDDVWNKISDDVALEDEQVRVVASDSYL